jgi:hypothetical protein
MSKKGTSGKMLPNRANLAPEEVRRFLKSIVYEAIEAGDIALSRPRVRYRIVAFRTNPLVLESLGANIEL